MRGPPRHRRILDACRSAVSAAVSIVREYALVFLILVGLLLAVSWRATTLWLVVAPVVFGLGLILLWGVRRPARGQATPSRGASLQTALFRAIVVALLAVFGIVMLIQWWDQRQAAEFAAEREDLRERAIMARGQLDLAYLLQPIRTSGYWDPPGGILGLHHALAGQGLWVNDTTYWRIRTIIDRFPANGGPFGTGCYSLLRRESWPAASILTPTQLRSFKSPHGNVAITSIQSWPSSWRYGLPPGVPSAASLKRHGFWIGAGTDPDRGGYRIAVWRTGPDSVYMFTSFDNALDSGEAPPRRLLRALYLLLLLAPVAGATAWYLQGRLVRPVAQVTNAASLLGSGGLPERIPEKGPAELATMARSFNRLADRLDEAEAAQKEFVASVNHELKTPLTSLQGYGELLSDGAVSAEEAGPVVLAETARLERLVGDLMESGRLDSGEFAVREEIVALDDVAADVRRRFGATAEGFGISLEVRHEPAGEAASVLADADRLVQVVSNLTENALRCTPSGGSVRIVVAPPAAIRVVDTGPGLAVEDLPRAFDRFYLYGRCGKDRPVGTGLGLSIVKELTEAMGGTVSVESEIGVGTAFAVELQTAAASPAQTTPGVTADGA